MGLPAQVTGRCAAPWRSRRNMSSLDAMELWPASLAREEAEDERQQRLVPQCRWLVGTGVFPARDCHQGHGGVWQPGAPAETCCGVEPALGPLAGGPPPTWRHCGFCAVGMSERRTLGMMVWPEAYRLSSGAWQARPSRGEGQLEPTKDRTQAQELRQKGLHPDSLEPRNTTKSQHSLQLCPHCKC